MPQTLQIEKKSNYTIVTLHRPEAQNALNDTMLAELKDAIHNLGKDGSTRLVLFTGTGTKSFCAGADITAMKDFRMEQAETFARLGHETMNAIAASDLISVAAINGYALGGGLELALACDFRVCSRNAMMALPEVGLGIIPGFGGTQRLPRIVGKGNAMEMILVGGMIDSERALRTGLVNHVFELEALLPSTEQLIEKMLAFRGPGAQKTARWVVSSGLDLPLSAGLEREINAFAELFSGKEPHEGCSAFLEKRKPQF